MRRWLSTIVLLSVPGFNSAAGAAAPKPEAAAVVHIRKQPGVYRSPSGKCVATISHTEGDRCILSVQDLKTALSEDVSAIAWIAGDRLVFTSSPVYGVPGLFVFDCDEDSARAIVPSRRSTEAYPDGGDYFELVRVGRGKNPEIEFRYFPDVDSLGTGGVASDCYVARVRLNGDGLRGMP